MLIHSLSLLFISLLLIFFSFCLITCFFPTYHFSSDVLAYAAFHYSSLLLMVFMRVYPDSSLVLFSSSHTWRHVLPQYYSPAKSLPISYHGPIPLTLFILWSVTFFPSHHSLSSTIHPIIHDSLYPPPFPLLFPPLPQLTTRLAHQLSSHFSILPSFTNPHYLFKLPITPQVPYPSSYLSSPTLPDLSLPNVGKCGIW